MASPPDQQALNGVGRVHEGARAKPQVKKQGLGAIVGALPCFELAVKIVQVILEPQVHTFRPRARTVGSPGPGVMKREEKRDEETKRRREEGEEQEEDDRRTTSEFEGGA